MHTYTKGECMCVGAIRQGYKKKSFLELCIRLVRSIHSSSRIGNMTAHTYTKGVCMCASAIWPVSLKVNC
jgi:hypothetical protein